MTDVTGHKYEFLLSLKLAMTSEQVYRHAETEDEERRFDQPILENGPSEKGQYPMHCN